MEYLIDYDTRSVLFQYDKPGLLTRYIDKNDLHLAVAVITKSDDLTDKLTKSEIVDFYNNFDTKSNLVSVSADMLFEEIIAKTHPRYTIAKGTSSIRALTGAVSAKKKHPSAWKQITMMKAGNEPSINHSIYTLWQVLVENGKPMHYDDFIDAYFFEYDVSLPTLKKNIAYAITLRYILEDE